MIYAFATHLNVNVNRHLFEFQSTNYRYEISRQWCVMIRLSWVQIKVNETKIDQIKKARARVWLCNQMAIFRVEKLPRWKIRKTVSIPNVFMHARCVYLKTYAHFLSVSTCRIVFRGLTSGRISLNLWKLKILSSYSFQNALEVFHLQKVLRNRRAGFWSRRIIRYLNYRGVWEEFSFFFFSSLFIYWSFGLEISTRDCGWTSELHLYHYDLGVKKKVHL